MRRGRAPLGVVATALCLGAAGCSLDFLNTDADAFNVRNETDLILEIEFEDGLFTSTVPPGAIGEMPLLTSDCATVAVVARSDGSEYARLTDKSLCENGTVVIIRGEGDMVIDGR